MGGQRAKKVVTDSPGLVDFAIGPVNSVFNLPDGQVMLFKKFEYKRPVKSILLVKRVLGLVEVTSGLANDFLCILVVNTRFKIVNNNNNFIILLSL